MVSCLFSQSCIIGSSTITITVVLQLSSPELHHTEQHRNRRLEEQEKDRRAAGEQQQTNSRTAVQKQRDSSRKVRPLWLVVFRASSDTRDLQQPVVDECGCGDTGGSEQQKSSETTSTSQCCIALLIVSVFWPGVARKGPGGPVEHPKSRI